MPLKKCSPVDVLLDIRMIRHSGIGTYLRGLLAEFQGNPFFQGIKLGLAAPDSLAGDVGDGKQIYRFNAPIYSLREQLEYPRLLAHCRLWHAPHYNAPLLTGKTRLVVTIHDIIHWIFRNEFYSKPQTLYAQCMLKAAIRQARCIIAVSRKTREDLLHHFNVPPEKIRVIYEGVCESFFNPPSVARRDLLLEKYGLPKKFFLYVGLIKPHKNVRRLVEVYRELRKEGKIASELVLVGKKDRNVEVMNGAGLHHIERVESKEELSALYASALALVHPSLYEGFGLTVLEAMASGTPVIASRAGSLPEVTGRAARFVDPVSGESIAEALKEVESNGLLRESLSKQGLEQARRFSWKKAAEETFRVYEEVLASP